MDKVKLERMKNDKGFIAALDQSGGSTPKALAAYGVPETAYSNEKEKIIGNVSHELHHMITSAYFTAVFETVVRDMTREQAMGYVEEIAVFFNSGWDGLLKLI